MSHHCRYLVKDVKDVGFDTLVITTFNVSPYVLYGNYRFIKGPDLEYFTFYPYFPLRETTKYSVKPL